MLACRLCFAFGVQDPEQWLEECPPRVLNLWRAFAVADGWAMQRRLDVLGAVSQKRLVASKYKKSDVEEAMESLDKLVEHYLPVDMRWEEDEKKPLDPDVLKVMNRGGGEVAKTPLHSTQIELDPWQQR